MNSPLDGRRVRYWAWVFGAQKKDISVVERVKAGPIGDAAKQAATEEVRRMLYVSVTRARDLLVVAVPNKVKDDSWLDTLGVDWTLPDGDLLSLPNGISIPTQSIELIAPDGWAVEREAYEARWVKPGDPAVGLTDRNLSPSKAEPVAQCKVGEIIDIGEPILIDGGQNATSLGQAIHGIIAAEIKAPGDESVKRAGRILEEWGLGDAVEPQAVINSARGFIDWVEKRFTPIAWHVEHPITHVINTGQVVHGLIDLLVETDQGWVIVDHKSTSRTNAEWEKIAEKSSGQLAMYKAAVEHASGQPVASAWIHFPTIAKFVSIQT
jgi:hypothetical protein